jgi:tartrate dehydratase alpha subunit/fumarate hydratase class I-like protein
MYKEVNTGTNLPAQIDLYSVDGDEYKFLCMAKGGHKGDVVGRAGRGTKGTHLLDEVVFQLRRGD